VSAGYLYTCGRQATGTAAAVSCWGYNGYAQVGDNAFGQRNVPRTTASGAPWETLSLSAGNNQTCVVRTDRTLWCWGDNTHGELGIGRIDASSTPLQVGVPEDWSSIATGTNHACGVLQGKLFCWGNNANGHLGRNSTTTQGGPSQSGAMTNWKTVTAGFNDSCGVQTDGSLWCWGLNDNGQLGTGNTTSLLVPTREAGLATDWDTVTTGRSHTCATRTSGALWCWGDNGYGQLGLGDTADRTSPVEVQPGTRWKSVSTGSRHTCGTQTDGTLWCWGDDSAGQLGDDATKASKSAPTRITNTVATYAEVSAGSDFTCATRDSGNLWCWGANTDGQLGTGNTTAQSDPTLIVDYTNWKTVTAGKAHACGTRTDGTVWCWGDNTHGQLGVGDFTSKVVPTRLTADLQTRIFTGSEAQATFTIG
jgi:alpha-tubulin suppressor-like RCC1 family protein